VKTSGTFHYEDQRSICAARLRQCVVWFVLRKGLEECACECYAAFRGRTDNHRRLLVDRMTPVGLNWRVPKLDLFLMMICSLFGTGQRAHPLYQR
jgi:hypothetical protein